MEMQWIRIGTKELCIVQEEDGAWDAFCECLALEGARVRIPLTEPQAREIFSGTTRLIQDVLPDMHPALREIFVTGITPAEFDLNVRGQLQAETVYANLGYLFERDCQDGED